MCRRNRQIRRRTSHRVSPNTACMSCDSPDARPFERRKADSTIFIFRQCYPIREETANTKGCSTSNEPGKHRRLLRPSRTTRQRLYACSASIDRRSSTDAAPERGCEEGVRTVSRASRRWRCCTLAGQAERSSPGAATSSSTTADTAKHEHRAGIQTNL